MPTIYTHLMVDLDAVTAVWIVSRFCPGFKEAKLAFVPANYDGAGMEEKDIAVDISIGIKGECGPDGTVHSAALSLADKYMPAKDRKAMDSLLKFVDAQDSTGMAVKHLLGGLSNEATKILTETSLNTVLRAIEASYPRNDRMVCERMAEILDGFLHNRRVRGLAKAEADKAELFGSVAVVKNSKSFGTNGVLFGRGARMVIFQDGLNMGIVRKDGVKIRADHPLIKKVVEHAGELDDWFAHPAGFLFCRGSRKAPATTPSRVEIGKLVNAARLALGEIQS